jgi:peptide/nickel transport system permease protein
MMRHVLGRLAQTALTLALLSLVVFLLARVLGDPLQYMRDLGADSEQVARVSRMLGIDRPLWVQYLDFLGHLLQGDLGVSIRQHEPVAAVIAQRFGVTIGLVLIAVSWAMAASLVLGTAAAVSRGGVLDWIARTVAVVGQSAPSFWIGIVMIQIFSVHLEWLPSAGIGGPAHYAMPAFTLGLLGVAGMTRLLRAGMLEALGSEYVKRARLMGASEAAIVFRHALRNACLPVLTYAGEHLGQLVTAAVVVEVIFALPGMGRLAYEAVFTRDYPLIQGVILTMATLIMLLNLIVDLMYAAIDPRIRYGRR